MSRAFASTVLPRVIAGDGAKSVQFIRANFGSGPVYLTTAPVDLTWNGHTWSSIGGELHVGEVTESPDDRAGGLPITLSGVDQSILSLILQEQYIGRTIEVWQGWIAVATNLFPNSGLETNANYVGYNGTTGMVVTRDSLASLGFTPSEGSWALRVATGNSVSDYLYLTDVVNWLSVRTDTDYEFFFDVRLNNGEPTRPWKAYVDWYSTTSGTLLGSSPTTFFNPQSGGWQRIEAAVGRPPAGATVGLPVIRPDTATGIYTICFDAIQFGPAGSALYQPTDGAAIIEGTVLADPIKLFVGFMNGGFQVTEALGRTGGRVTIEGQIVSRLAPLAQSRGIRTNLESHQLVSPNDLFFDRVPSLANREIVWGRTSKSLTTNPSTPPRDRR